jgi:cation transport ATPase
MPLALVFRYRAGTARRQARGWVALLNLVGLAISTSLFLMGAGLTSIWVPHAFTYSVLGLLGGIALGIVGLWLSRWERAPGSLHYTPNRWLVLIVTVVVAALLLYGFWRMWNTWRHAPGEASLLAAFGVAGSLCAGAVVLGYYLSYWLGVRRRSKAHASA